MLYIGWPFGNGGGLTCFAGAREDAVRRRKARSLRCARASWWRSSWRSPTIVGFICCSLTRPLTPRGALCASDARTKTAHSFTPTFRFSQHSHSGYTEDGTHLAGRSSNTSISHHFTRQIHTPYFGLLVATEHPCLKRGVPPHSPQTSQSR